MIRKTRQRETIRRVIEESPRPLLPLEVLAAGKEFVPGLGIATVYRALRELSETGEIRIVELPGEPVCYESARLSHHHHFKCVRCGKIFDIHGCLEGIDHLAPPGFQVESHEIFLFGRCQECVARANPPA